MTGILLGYGIVVALLVGASWYRGAIGGTAAQRAATRRFAERVGLPGGRSPDPELVPRVVRRYRFVMAGVAVGLFAPAAIPLEPAIDTYGGLAFLLLGLTAGAVLAQVTEPGPEPDTTRVAHTVDPALTDYVPRWALQVVALGVAAVIGLTVVAVAVPMHHIAGSAPGTSSRGVVALGAGAVLLSALAFWAARTVVRRRRTVTSATELAVDDALRGQAVRDCLGLSAATSVGALLVISLRVDNAAGLTRILHGWTPVAGIVVAVIALCVHEWTGGPRWWRTRLHPELEKVA